MFDHSKTILHHNHEINSDYLSCLLIYGLVLIELSDLVLIYLINRTIYKSYVGCTLMAAIGILEKKSRKSVN